jgi:predicted dehydrogenase
MLRAGIIGLGKMGLSHAAIVNGNEKVTLVAVCDTSSLILQAFKKYSEIATYTDYKDMLEKENLDFVVIATPTKWHYPITKKALQKKINVFCEKPFSLNTKEGEELVHLAKQNSLVNQVGYHNHFIGTFRELKRLLDTQVIGELVHFTGEAYGPVVTKEKGRTWRSKPEEGGGCIYDYASHVINLIQEVLGNPVKINGSIVKSIFSKGVDDAVFSLLTLEKNLSGTLLVNWSDETYRKMSTVITVQGKKGKIICDATEIKIYLKEDNNDERLKKGWTIKYITEFAIPVQFYLRGEEYSSQIEYFVDNIINNKMGIYNTFEQALYTDKVIQLILKKANEINNG